MSTCEQEYSARRKCLFYPRVSDITRSRTELLHLLCGQSIRTGRQQITTGGEVMGKKKRRAGVPLEKPGK